MFNHQLNWSNSILYDLHHLIVIIFRFPLKYYYDQLLVWYRRVRCVTLVDRVNHYLNEVILRHSIVQYRVNQQLSAAITYANWSCDAKRRWAWTVRFLFSFQPLRDSSHFNTFIELLLLWSDYEVESHKKSGKQYDSLNVSTVYRERVYVWFLSG